MGESHYKLDWPICITWRISFKLYLHFANTISAICKSLIYSIVQFFFLIIATLKQFPKVNYYTYVAMCNCLNSEYIHFAKTWKALVALAFSFYITNNSKTSQYFIMSIIVQVHKFMTWKALIALVFSSSEADSKCQGLASLAGLSNTSIIFNYSGIKFLLFNCQAQEVSLHPKRSPPILFL